MGGYKMRIAFEVLLAVFGLFAAYYIVNLNDQYADMVASVQTCDIQFNASVATVPCTINGEVAKVSFNHD